MNKKMIARTLASLVLVAVILTSGIHAARAEDQKLYSVSIDVDIIDNFIFARYGVTVYVDDTEMGYLPHGKRMTKIVELALGKHVLRLKPKYSYITPLSVEFNVEGATYMEAKVTTHESYICLNKLRVICSSPAETDVKQEPIPDMEETKETEQNQEIKETEQNQEEEPYDYDKMEQFLVLMFRPWLYSSYQV